MFLDSKYVCYLEVFTLPLVFWTDSGWTRSGHQHFQTWIFMVEIGVIFWSLSDAIPVIVRPDNYSIGLSDQTVQWKITGNSPRKSNGQSAESSGQWPDSGHNATGLQMYGSRGTNIVYCSARRVITWPHTHITKPSFMPYFSHHHLTNDDHSRFCAPSVVI